MFSISKKIFHVIILAEDINNIQEQQQNSLKAHIADEEDETEEEETEGRGNFYHF